MMGQLPGWAVPFPLMLIRRDWTLFFVGFRRWRKRARWARHKLSAAPSAMRIVVIAATVLAVFSATNLVYQIVRKPTEMLFPVSGTMNKMPAEREPLSVASAFCERLIINLLRLWRIQMESALAHAVPGTLVIVEVCVLRCLSLSFGAADRRRRNPDPDGKRHRDRRDDRRNHVECRLISNLPDQDARENRPRRFADVPDRAEHPHPGPEAPCRDQIGD